MNYKSPEHRDFHQAFIKHIKKRSKERCQSGEIKKNMDDKTLMPFGEHKGKKMANVPAYYLLWLYNNNKCYGELKKYIEDNMDALKQGK